MTRGVVHGMYVCVMSRHGVISGNGHSGAGSGLDFNTCLDATCFYTLSLNILICGCNTVSLAVETTTGHYVGEGTLSTVKLHRKVTSFCILFSYKRK